MKGVFTYSGLIAILVIIISSIDRFSETVISISICVIISPLNLLVNPHTGGVWWSKRCKPEGETHFRFIRIAQNGRWNHFDHICPKYGHQLIKYSLINNWDPNQSHTWLRYWKCQSTRIPRGPRRSCPGDLLASWSLWPCASQMSQPRQDKKFTMIHSCVTKTFAVEYYLIMFHAHYIPA